MSQASDRSSWLPQQQDAIFTIGISAMFFGFVTTHASHASNRNTDKRTKEHQKEYRPPRPRLHLHGAVKIGRHLSKSWTKVMWRVFWLTVWVNQPRVHQSWEINSLNWYRYAINFVTWIFRHALQWDLACSFVVIQSSAAENTSCPNFRSNVRCEAG